MRSFKFLLLTLLLFSAPAEAQLAQTGVGTSASFASLPSGPGPLATNGDSHAVTGQWAESFYDSTTFATWVSWARSPDGSTRRIYVAAYYHQKGLWCPGFGSSPATGCPNSGASVEAGGYIVATNPNTDSHGAPGMALDQYGRANIFFGAHNSAIKYSYSTNVHDPSAWTAGSDISTINFTQANPVLVGSTLYVFTQGGASSNDVSFVSGTAASGGGVSSWTAVQITNFSGFGWLGNAVVRGTNICFAFTFAPNPDVYINDAYYGCYNTTNGSFVDVSGANVITSGNLPFNRTTAQADFLVYQSPDTSHSSIIPDIAFDPGGTLHVIYANGLISNTSTSAGTYTLYETHWTGAAWSPGVQVAGSAVLEYFFQTPIVIPTATGIAAYWGQQNSTLEDATYATLPIGGSWSSATKLVSAQAWPISSFSPIFGAVSAAQVLFAAQPSLTASGGNNSLYGTSALWIYGGATPISAPYQTPASIATLGGYWTFDTAQCSGTTTNDSSGNSANGTMSGTGFNCASSETTGQIAQALQFTAASSNINYGTPSSIQPTSFPITVTFWLNISAYDANFSNVLITNSTGNCGGIAVEIDNNGHLVGQYGDGAGSTSTHFYEAKSSATLPTGSWQFVTYRFASSQTIMASFGNGAEAQLGSPSGTATTIGNVGGSTAASGHLGASTCNGAIDGPVGSADDLRFYTGTVNPWQRSQIFWQGIAGHQ